jgi:hypothetical protein
MTDTDYRYRVASTLAPEWLTALDQYGTPTRFSNGQHYALLFTEKDAHNVCASLGNLAVVEMTNPEVGVATRLPADPLNPFMLPSDTPEDVRQRYLDIADVFVQQGEKWKQHIWLHVVGIGSNAGGLIDAGYSSPDEYVSNALEIGPCGTSGCVCGWASVKAGVDKVREALSLLPPKPKHHNPKFFGWEWERSGQFLLNVDNDLREWLFSAERRNHMTADDMAELLQTLAEVDGFRSMDDVPDRLLYEEADDDWDDDDPGNY